MYTIDAKCCILSVWCTILDVVSSRFQIRIYITHQLKLFTSQVSTDEKLTIRVTCLVFSILQVDGPHHWWDSTRRDRGWRAYHGNTVFHQNDMEIFIESKILSFLFSNLAMHFNIFDTFLSGYFPQHWSGSNKWFLSIAWQRAGLYRQYIGL